jgi:hypothetical protein
MTFQPSDMADGQPRFITVTMKHWKRAAIAQAKGVA